MFPATSAMLAVLAEGINRLAAGDQDQQQQADEVRRSMALNHRLALNENGVWVPANQATHGYVRLPHQDEGVVATLRDQGWFAIWSDGWKQEAEECPSGTVLYCDEACTIPLRTL